MKAPPKTGNARRSLNGSTAANALRRQDRLLQAVSEATVLLLNGLDAAQAIHGALALVGEATGADRAYIFETHPHPATGRPATTIRFEWCREGIEPQIHNPELYAMPFYEIGLGRFYEALRDGRSVNHLVSELPPDERPLFEQQGILAILLVPIQLVREHWGSVGFDNCRSRRRWSRSEEHILASMAAIIGGTLMNKRAEVSLTRAKDEAERANQAKSDFLSSMSHELRTPLNAILGFAELLGSDLETPLTDLQKEDVAHIRKAGDHLLRLINDVLDLARIESGKLALSLGPVTIGPLVDECLTLVRRLAESRRIDVIDESARFHFEAIRADRTRLKQVLLNLLSNAVKYNREGGSVVLSVEPISESRIRIRVSDTGRGILESEREKLFQPFCRLGAEGSDIEGSGIGLTITRRLVELMDGFISLQSTPGVGSEFFIELPAAFVSGAPVHPSEGSEVPARTGERLVLYIEDNAANVALVSRILSRRPGVRLISASRASDGIALAREHRPHLIFMDINLPDRSGVEALKLLWEDTSARLTPVFALSADAMPHAVERALAAGFRLYFTKPIDVASFLKAVDEHLGLSRAV